MKLATANKQTPYVLFLLLLISQALWAQNSTPEWEKPEIFGINKLAPHAHFIPFQNQEMALTFDKDKSDRYQSLNGAWDFNFFPIPMKRQMIFSKSSML